MEKMLDTFSERIQFALRREALMANAKVDAINFAWECKSDLEKLRQEIQDSEELIADPELASTTMAPTASPRIYRESYLEGLKRAVEIVEAHLDVRTPPAEELD